MCFKRIPAAFGYQFILENTYLSYHEHQPLIPAILA